MRKVIKIFLSVLSAIILAAIILPVTAFLLLFLPPVQHYVVKEASEYASRMLGTTVTFDKVRIKLFNAAEFDGLYVEDYQGDTLLYVGHVGTGVDMRAMMRHEILLRDVKLKDSRLYVKRYADGSTSLGQVLDRFRSEEQVPIKLIAASLDGENMRFRYKRYDDVGVRPTGINPDDMDFSGIGIHARDLSVIGDSVSLRLDGLSLREKSGFILDDFSCPWIVLTPDGLNMDHSQIHTPETALELEKLRIGLDGDGTFIDRARITAALSNSTFSLGTLGYFVPGQYGSPAVFRQLNATLSGRMGDLSGMASAEVGDSTRLFMLYAMQGLPNLDSTRFSVVLDSLVTTSSDVHTLSSWFTGRELGDSLSTHVDNMGDIVLKGSFNGKPRDFTAHAWLHTAQGKGEADLTFFPLPDRQTAFSGRISLEDFELGAAIGAPDIGRLSLSGRVDGRSGGGIFAANTDLALSRLEYNGYDYHDITMDGRVWNRQFMGRITSGDPNLSFDFDGLLDFNDSIPRYDFAIDLANADLRKLNFNRRDSVSCVSFRARVAGTGNHPDNMNGRITIDDMLYVNHLDSIRTGTITITGENSDQSKMLRLNSDFADATFRSRLSYSRLAEYLTSAFYTYLPSLSESARPCIVPDFVRTSEAENYSVFNVEVKQANNVAGIFSPGLILAEGSKLSVTFNPDTERFSLTASSDYIEQGNSFVSDLEVNGRNQGDSLSLFVRAAEAYTSGFLLPDLSLIGGARDNKINASVRFNNPEKEQSALLGVNVALSTDAATGLPEAAIRLTPSYYKQGGQQWNIFTRGITASRGRVAVDRFGIEGSGQQLWISGTASGSRGDTLNIDVRNFDINPASGLLNIGYQFYGRASGQAAMSSVFDNPILTAAIDLDSMYVDQVAVPPMRFMSSWEAEHSRARFLLMRHDDPDPIAFATYIPSTRRIDGAVHIENMDFSLLDVHYEGTLSKTAGSGDLDATISGFGRKIKLNGTLDIHDYSSLVDFLNVPYSTAPGTQLTIRDNVLRGDDITLLDPDGNTGAMDFAVDLNNLNNVSYTFNIRPEDMLLLNTTPAENELFYGTVYGSGTLALKGSKQGVSMDITAGTSDNSRFYMPLSDKTDMADADFVTFIRPRQRQVADTTEYNIRKRMIMNRSSGKRRIESSGNIDTNIALTVRPNTLVELLIDPQTGHTVRARGNAQINMHVNPRNNEFTMYGDYQIDEGVYLFTLENIIEKPFAIEQGSNIQWTGDPVDAMLNISGVYRLKTSISPAVNSAVGGPATDEGQQSPYASWRTRTPVECRIMLADRLSMPSLTFNITAPDASPEAQQFLSQFLNTQETIATQFFFLLATGNFYDYEGNTGNIGAAAGSATAFDFLSNQLSNWISSDRFNIGIRYRPRGETTSDEWGIDLSQQLLGNRLLLEIEGNYDTRNNDNAIYSENMKNFTGDFYLTGLLDKAGSLKAKIFTRTITRFDENQGLQESGVGLYYTEDFNTFGDVLRNLKERFTGERRRKRRLQRQLEREARQQTDARDEEVPQAGVTFTTGDEEAQEPTGVRFTTGDGDPQADEKRDYDNE